MLTAVNHGLVAVNGEKHLVEIKCPYAARDMTVEEAVSNVKSFCLSKEGDELTLRHTHKYYYQVQVQLHVCKIIIKVLFCCVDTERLLDDDLC